MTSTMSDIEDENSPVCSIFIKSSELQDALSVISNASTGTSPIPIPSSSLELERRNVILDYIKHVTRVNNVIAPDFEMGLDWFNTNGPLSLRKELSGKIVILDFFTYCCINCMHILPDLEHFESKFKVTDGVVLVGVHSAKFSNENDSANILNAVLRYNIRHPVVNDQNAVLWEKLEIHCWPTLVVLSPSAEILLMVMGEGNGTLLEDFVQVALDYYDSLGDIQKNRIDLTLTRDSLPPSPLLFPGKLAVNDKGDRLVVSDTSHNRLLVVDMNGVVLECIGGQEPGFKDGSFQECRFRAPQGVCWKGDSGIFVADTENHAIRKIDLKVNQVVTVAGTGLQGRDYEGGEIGSLQCISSPWDLLLTKSSDSQEENVLYIAMAGTHQIWIFFLEDAEQNGRNMAKGTCIRYAGSGLEENRNNRYPHKAGFAQPSGLAVGQLSIDKEDQYLFVADSESSSVRTVSLTDGAVKALAGGTLDPKNLFAFGDQDGKGMQAKLQHPLGVAMKNCQSGPLLVADTYNHKIKTIDVATAQCKSFLGSGVRGNKTGFSPEEVELNEPGGISMHPAGTQLYIADTNNHSIKVFDFELNILSEMAKKLIDQDGDCLYHVVFPRRDSLGVGPPYVQAVRKALSERGHWLPYGILYGHLSADLAIRFVENPSPDGHEDVDAEYKTPARLTPSNATIIDLPSRDIIAGESVVFQLVLSLQPGWHLTEGAPSAWQVVLPDDSDLEPSQVQPLRGQIGDLDNQDHVMLKVPSDWLPGNRLHLEVEVVVYYCDDIGLCKMKALRFKQKSCILSDKDLTLPNRPVELKYHLT